MWVVGGIGGHIMEPWYKMRGVEAHMKGALSSEWWTGGGGRSRGGKWGHF